MRTSFVLPETTLKIFLSHHSRQKLLVREIKRRLPEFIDIWIDEKDILIGDDLKGRIFQGIDEEADYVVLFLDEYAAKSLWVRKEIEWALEKETAQSRAILLPLLIDNLTIRYPHPAIMTRYGRGFACSPAHISRSVMVSSW